MFKLIQHSSKITNILRYSLLKLNNFHQTSNFQTIKTQFMRNVRKEQKLPVLTSKIGVFLTGGYYCILQINLKRKVLCEEKRTRMIGYKKSDQNYKLNWGQFWTYLQPHIWYFVAAIAGALVVAFLNIIIPQTMGSVVNILNEFTKESSSEVFMEKMKSPVIKLVSMYIGQSLCTFFYIYMLSNLGEKIAFQMKTDLFANILRQDIAFFDQHRTGEIVHRLTTDIQDFKSSFKQTVSGGLRAMAQIVGCSVSLIMISPHMTLLTLMCIPTVVAIGTFFGALLRNVSKKAHDQVEKTTAVADEAVSNIRTVRAFAMEDQELEMFNTEAELAMIFNQNLGFGIGWFQAGTNLFLNSMVLTTMYMGGYLLTTDQLTAGELMAYLMASQTIQRSLAQISMLFGAVVRGTAAGGRVFEYINLKPTMPLQGGERIRDLQGNIAFRNVTFAYPTRELNVLENFNLEIKSGSTVAIVGASGNGKSTIVALLERFYDIQNGSITIDGYDIRNLDPVWLRGHVLGLISQEPILFGTTVMENIRYGRLDANDEDVKKAAQLANADEFIRNFPEGYQTLVGERGATLSGGQKQRIAIARALLKNPAILLLDEATSALDTESEKIVQTALDKAREGRTVIIIAHRLSTIQNADVILVLNKGKIVEMGTHESLTKLKGYYWSLTFQQKETPAG